MVHCGVPAGICKPKWQRYMALVSPRWGLMLVCGRIMLNDADTILGIFCNNWVVTGHLRQLRRRVMPQANNTNTVQLVAWLASVRLM